MHEATALYRSPIYEPVPTESEKKKETRNKSARRL